MARVLEGYRVLDFTHVLAGPIATNFLRLHGADVIKVESPHGDTMRHYGEGPNDGMGPSFVSVNAGKRSIVLDLKNDGHKEVARRLVAQADVVVENFRPGVMDRLGLGYAACKLIKPDLVFCSVSGFGQSGPLKNNPAIDQIIQSMSGLMTLSGVAGSPAMRVGFPIVDTFTGALAAMAIVMALLGRERSGQGQCIDVAMMDAAMVMMVSVAGPFLVAGIEPSKTGNLGYSKSPTADTFPTAAGEITIGATNQQQFEALCGVVGRDDLVDDARFADKWSRRRHGAALRSEMVAALAARPAQQWEQLLNDAGVAAGAVRDLAGALGHPHFAARQLALSVPAAGAAGGTTTRVLNSGFLFAHDGAAIDAPPPRLGEHTRQVLEELGYDTGRIDALVGTMAAGAARQHVV